MPDRYTPEQRREYQKKYRERRRREALELLGGKCVECGSTEDLEFDHIDPSTKLFNISGFFQSKAMMLEEIKKCQLLCRLHHRRKTSDQRPPRGANAKCGTIYMYDEFKCRCEPCRDAKRRTRK